MPFLAAEFDWRFAAGITMVVALVGAIAWGSLVFYRWFERSAERSQQHALAGITVYSAPRAGTVVVQFHTYSGLLAWYTQRELRFWATPQDAREALARLHRFNLYWGFFAYVPFIVAILSYFNYWIQCRSIDKQARELAAR